MSRKDLLGNVERVVIKIGTTSLMQDGKTISIEFLDSITEQVKRLRDQGMEVLIVTSGSIGVGLKAMGVKANPNDMPLKQAAASVGQSKLMNKWSDSFDKNGILVAQILMSFDNYSDRTSALNLNNTIDSLLDHGIVPIFNENDAVCINEIKFGDNDTLSAIVASRVDADLLVILSDIDGLYDSNPDFNPDAKMIPVVENIDTKIKSAAGESSSGLGTGGMKTKILAAEICKDAGCAMIIAKSTAEDVVYRAATGDEIGTIFVSDTEITKKRRWIKAAHASGSLIIDEGAMKAVLDHRSLLPVGVRSVEGSFAKGEVVDIVCNGEKIAKGIVGYDSKEMSSIAGKHTWAIEKVIGGNKHNSVINSENIVIL